MLRIADCQVKAQDVLLEEDVNADTVASTTGPNKKYFSYSAIGLAFPVSPDSTGSRIYYGKSFEMFLGRRIKWRVCNFYAFGLDLAYRLTSYNLRPTETKVLPNDSVHGKELLRFHKYAFTASYRLSDLFIRDANVYAKYGNGLTKYPELPVINAGLEIGVF